MSGAGTGAAWVDGGENGSPIAPGVPRDSQVLEGKWGMPQGLSTAAPPAAGALAPIVTDAPVPEAAATWVASSTIIPNPVGSSYRYVTLHSIPIDDQTVQAKAYGKNNGTFVWLDPFFVHGSDGHSGMRPVHQKNQTKTLFVQKHEGGARDIPHLCTVPRSWTRTRHVPSTDQDHRTGGEVRASFCGTTQRQNHAGTNQSWRESGKGGGHPQMARLSYVRDHTGMGSHVFSRSRGGVRRPITGCVYCCTSVTTAVRKRDKPKPCNAMGCRSPWPCRLGAALYACTAEACLLYRGSSKNRAPPSAFVTGAKILHHEK
jgi:hypothetical protein